MSLGKNLVQNNVLNRLIFMKKAEKIASVLGAPPS